MTFSLAGSTITQSGTDTSLAGLEGISGVNVITVSTTATYPLKIYVLSGRQLRNTGSLTYNAVREMLVFDTTCTSPEFYGVSGGSLTINSSLSLSGTNYGHPNLSMDFRRLSSVPWSTPSIETDTSHVTTLNGGLINLAGATFRGTLVTNECSFYGWRGLSSTGLALLRIQNAWSGTGCFFYNSTALATSPSNLSVGNVSLKAETATFEFQSGTVFNLNNWGTTSTFGSYGATRGAMVNMYNLPNGSAETFNFILDDIESQRLPTYMAAWKKCIFNTKTPSGVNVQNAIVYVKDYNNGSRRNTSTTNFVDDRTAIYQTNSSGNTIEFNVLLGVRTVTSHTGRNQDQRTKDGSNNDIFDITTWSYGYLNTVNAVSMKGSGTLNTGTTLFTDPSVTLSESSAGTLTSIANLDNLYDAGKHWKTRNVISQIEYPTVTTQPITANGSILDLGNRNLIIDATASSAFSINTGTNTITIKSTNLIAGSKFNSIATTGTITTVNGATISCPYKDSLGVRCILSIVGGGAFNIKTSVSTYDTNVTSETITIAPNTDFRYAIWSLGKEPKTRILNSGDVGGNFVIELTDISDRVNTSLDVSGFIANTTTTVDGSGYHIIWTGTNILNLEQTKATTHQLMRYENYLNALLALGDDTVAEIFADYIRINKPLFTLELTTGIQRTEINAFIDVDPAKVINPSYILNPSNNVGLYVNYIGIPTAIDYAYMAEQVWVNDTRTLTDSPGLTTEEHDRLFTLPTSAGGGFRSPNDFNAQDRRILKETHEKVLKLENPDLTNIGEKLTELSDNFNETNSHIDIAKQDIINTINSSENEICSDIIRKTKELKEDNVKTRNLVRQKTEKIEQNVSKLADRQDLTDKLIEDEADEIENEIERILNEEADMIENEIYNSEADEIENEINSNQSNDGND